MHRFPTGLLLIVMAAIGLGDARGAQPRVNVYAQPPAWWNQVVLAGPTRETNSADACWNWLKANAPPQGKPVGGWLVTGPFEGEKGTALDRAYPPETAGDRTSIPGAGSQTVAWTHWPAGTPYPLANRHPDTIAYATWKLTLKAASDGGLTVSSRAGYWLWVDDRPVVTNGAAGDGDYVALKLAAGTHSFLVKAYLPDGDWTWSATWADVDPRMTEIKARSFVVSLWPRDKSTIREHAPRLAALYLDLDDAVNGQFWVSAALTGLRADVPGATAALDRWRTVASRRPSAGPALNRELGEFLGRLSKDDPLCPVLVNAVCELGLALSRPDETASLLRAAGVKLTPDRALHMAQRSWATNMVDSVAFWLEPYLEHFQPSALSDGGQFSRTVTDWLQRSTEPFRRALYESLDRAVTAGTNDTLRALLADCYMQDVLARQDAARAAQFLKNHAGILAAKRPFEAAVWRLQVATLENNETAAREALDAAVLARPVFTNSDEYAQYRGKLFKFNTTVPVPAAVDLAPDEAPATAERLAKSGNTNRLCVYLRDLLNSRGDSTIPVETDHNLFAGAKARYRKSLAAYAPVYEAWLQAEVNTLAAVPSRRDDAERLDRTGHLALPAVVVGAGAAGSEAVAGAAPAATGFKPLIDMAPGLSEVIEDQFRYLLKADPAPAASLTVSEGDSWLANSHLLACLRGGVVTWSWAAPLPGPSQRGEQNKLPSYFRIGGRCEPALAGNLVAVRILLTDATAAVVGLARDTGIPRWTWRPAKGVAAGAPVAWGTNRFVVMTVSADDMVGCRSDLVVLDRFGVEQAIVRLGGCPVAGGPNWRVADQDVDPALFWSAPAPTVEGNVAYVSTALGLVGAVNLADESIIWLRNYNHAVSDGGSVIRTPRAPLLGRDTVLFAPPDSNRLLLLDKATGRLTASRTDLAWSDLAPCGSNAVLVVGPTTASVISLADLSERRVATGRSYGIVQPVRGGCLLAERNGAVTFCGADATLTARAPASDRLRLLGCGSDGTWYVAGGPGGQWCGVLGDRDESVTGLIRPQRHSVSLCDMETGTLVPTGGSVPLVSNGLVLMGVAGDGRRLWELPMLAENGLATEKGHMLVARGGRAWIYDERTADLLATWPVGYGLTQSVIRVISTPEGGYAIGPDADQRMTLWKLAVDKGVSTRVVSHWAPNAFNSPISGAAVILSATQVVALVQHYHPNGPVTLWAAPREATSAVFTRKNGNSGDAYLWASPDGRRAAVVPQELGPLAVAEAGGLREVKPHLTAGRIWSYGHRYSEGDLLIVSRDDDKTLVALNPATGASLDLTRQDVVMPAVVGTRVYGLKVTRAGSGPDVKLQTIRSYTCDVDGHTEPTVGPVLPAWIAGAIGRNHTAAGAIKSDGGATLIASGLALAWRGTLAQEPRPLPVIQQPDNERWSQSRYLQVWETPQGVVNVGGVWMGPAQWQSVLQLSNTVHAGTPEARLMNVDGFLDEWQTNDFFAIPFGRMAVSLNAAGELSLAVEIQDADLAERLGVAGLDDGLTLSAGPVSALGFIEPPPSPVGPTLKPFRRTKLGGQVIECAWSVTPDGTRCRVEASVSGVYGDAGRRRDGQSRAPVGVRLLWRRNSFEEPVNLVANGAWGPLSYVRVSF